MTKQGPKPTKLFRAKQFVTIAGTKIGKAASVTSEAIRAAPEKAHKARLRYYELEDKVAERRLELARKRAATADKLQMARNLNKKRKPRKPFTYNPFG